MTTIGLSANDQLLAVTLNPKVTSGQQNTVDVHVEFSDDWDRFAKSAVFFTSNNTNTVYEKVLTNGECIVPAEVMSKDGVLYIGVRGVNSQNNEVKTTSLVKYKISEGSPSGTGTEVEPTPNVYQQLLSAYGKTDNSINKEITDRKSAIATEKTERQTEIAVERNRITNLATLSEGSTTGDAELIDARVGGNGFTYESLGEAIRSQIGNNGFVYDFTSENAEFIENKYYNSTNGSLNTASGFRVYIIPIELGDVVKITTRLEHPAVLLDRNKNFISGYTKPSRVYENIEYVITDANAKYIALNTVYAEINQFYFAIHQPLAENIKKLKQSLNEIKSKWYGKTIIAFGDSITYGYGAENVTTDSYPSQLAEITGANVNNQGISASFLSNANHEYDLVNRYEGLPDSDLIIISGGTNDYWHRQPVGNVTDTDITTFCGALNTILSGLTTRETLTRVCFVFPYQQFYFNVTSDVDRNYGSFKAYRDAAETICNKYSVPFLDLFNSFGYDIKNSIVHRQYISSDGCHLNTVGYRYLAERIAKFIENI